MEQCTALIWNQFDVYDRHWVRQNSNETSEQFIKRIKKCYSNDQWVIDFYKATPIDVQT